MSQNVAEEIQNDDAVEGMHQMEAQMRRCDEENSALRLIKKDLKGRGHDVQAMLRAIRNRKRGGEKTITDMRTEIKYTGLQRIPITPETLFDGMDFTVTEKTEMGQDVWDAEENGYMSGKHGVPSEDCPYPAGSELQVRWLAFWTKGDTARERAHGPDVVIASATRRPRRRQPRLDIPPNAPIPIPRRRGARRRSPEVADNGVPVY